MDELETSTPPEVRQGLKVKTITQRFEEKYQIITETGCWIWVGCLQSKGYGYFSNSGSILAHRFSYELHRGQIPQGMQLDHLCRVRCCVNPWHLEIVSNRINLLRGDTLAASNYRKTHCHRGHPFSGTNLYIETTGKRKCRTCQKLNRKAATLST